MNGSQSQPHPVQHRRRNSQRHPDSTSKRSSSLLGAGRDAALGHIEVARDFLHLAQIMLEATDNTLAAWADENPLSPEIDKLLDLEGECCSDSFENVTLVARAEMEMLLNLIPRGSRLGSDGR